MLDKWVFVVLKCETGHKEKTPDKVFKTLSGADPFVQKTSTHLSHKQWNTANM